MNTTTPTMGTTNFFLVDGVPGSDAADLPLREAGVPGVSGSIAVAVAITFPVFLIV
jgi:hypothetical protein